jgi:translation initiation factor 4G
MLQIRSARTDDADFLGWVILTAARGHLERGWFDVVLQRHDAFCLEYCSKLAGAAARSRWHRSLFSVAEVDGRPAAALCGFGDRFLYAASSGAMAEASQKMGLSEEEHARLWPRGAFILSCTTSEEGAWTIENMATLPEYCRTGATQALLCNELERARAAGYTPVQVSFFVGNRPPSRHISRPDSSLPKKSAPLKFNLASTCPG